MPTFDATGGINKVLTLLNIITILFDGLSMENLTLEQLRSVIVAGGVRSITLDGAGAGFAVCLATHRGPAVLVTTNTGTPRLFADPRRALALLKDLGIIEVAINTKNWTQAQSTLI